MSQPKPKTLINVPDSKKVKSCYPSNSKPKTETPTNPSYSEVFKP